MRVTTDRDLFDAPWRSVLVAALANGKAFLRRHLRQFRTRAAKPDFTCRYCAHEAKEITSGYFQCTNERCERGRLQ